MHEEETGEVGGSSAFKRVSANEEKKVYENNRIASTIPLFSCNLKSRACEILTCEMQNKRNLKVRKLHFLDFACFTRPAVSEMQLSD